MPESAQDQENTQEVTLENPATGDVATNSAAVDDTAATAENDEDDDEGEEEENTNMSGDGTVEMLQETVYSNDDDEAEEPSPSKDNLAPVPNMDENTILLPVSGENGFVAEDTAVDFNPTDFLEGEEDVIDPMAGTANRLVEKTISQVPKKRRIPDTLSYEEEDDDDSPERNQKRRGRKPGTKVINGQVIYPSDEVVNSIKKNNPRVKLHSMTSVTPAKTPKSSSPLIPVDENQCRVCTSTDDLVSIFKKEFQKTYADKLMAICTVNILRDDFLPLFICSVCVSSVNAAYALKLQCEQTDAEFRGVFQAKTVKKVRKVTKYVESDHEDIPEPVEDQDFKLSDASPPSAEDDSDSDSDKPLLKKRPRQRRSRKSSKNRSEKRHKKSKNKRESSSPLKKSIKSDPDLNNSKNSADGDPTKTKDFSSGSEEDYSPPKRRRGKGRKTTMRDSANMTCSICHETFNSREELREHKKSAHSSFDCELCGRKFKMQSSLKTHMEKHTSLKILNCESCNLHFPNKTERRRHMQDTHKDAVAQYSCEKCKRAFTSETRLQKHKESNCPGFDTSQKKRGDLDSLSMGKDLFKCVAPLTTTYWSDSFSD